MRYQVTFRKRFNERGQGSDAPQDLLNLPDGVVLEASIVQETEPDSLHGDEAMDEDDNILPFGDEIWEYVVADERKDEFISALKESGVVLEYDEIEDEEDESDRDGIESGLDEEDDVDTEGEPEESRI
jgi:hypothetical protein